MGINITITDAELLDARALRRLAFAIEVIASGKTTADNGDLTRAESEAAWDAVNADGRGGQICEDERPLDLVAPPPPPAPSSANANPPPIAPAAIGAPPPPPASAPPAPSDASETSHVQTDAAPGNPALGVDKNGFPWDARIHSSSQNKNADGTWRLRRGVAPATVDAVLAELRAGVSAPPPPATEQVASAAQVPPPPAATAAAEVPPPAATAAAEVPPPPPGATPQPNVTIAPPASGTGPSPYIQLVMDVSNAIQAKKLTPDESASAYTSLGLTGLDGFSTRADLIGPYRAILGGKL